MSLCLLEEAAKQLSRHVIDQVLESRQGQFLNGKQWTKGRFYIPVCCPCFTEARNGAGGPAHASSAAAAAEDRGDEVMLRAIAASLEDFDKSQAKAASLLASLAEPTEHLDGVGDAEDPALAAAIRLSQVEY